jgi:hypothetical protein
MRTHLNSVSGGKLVKVFGSVLVLLALGVAATGILSSDAEVSAEPQAKAQPTVAEEPAEANPRLVEARQFKEKGRLKLAAVLVESVLAHDRSHPAAWELYLDIAMAKALSAEEEGHYGEAQRAYSTAMQALKEWRSVLVQSRAPTPNAAIQVTRQEDLQHRIDAMGQKVIATARKLYERGKREHWYSAFGDDEEAFIQALVTLDSVNVSHLSPEVRREHAAIWDKCYGELSSGQVARYKRLSALSHGNRPNGRG